MFFMSSPTRGFQVNYPSITLHAISRSETVGSHIYCQLEDRSASSGDDGKIEDDEDVPLVELKLTPQNASSCKSSTSLRKPNEN